MNKIVISRINYAPTYTLGFIRYKDFFCFTLEPGKPVGKGCIPCGVYPIVWEWSEKFSMRLWELKNVPGRSEIKVHAGNTVKNTEGCILLGYSFEDEELSDVSYLGVSAAAVHDFNQLCHAEKITHIEIRDV